MTAEKSGCDPDRTVAGYIRALKRSRFGSQVAAHRFEKPRPAEYRQTSSPLPPFLCSLLAANSMERLYSHQAEALDLLHGGHDILVATATASGKSLIYNLPVLSETANDNRAKALYLFPLKALAQDQLRRLNHLGGQLPGKLFGEDRLPGGLAAIYDGDTSGYFRKKIRERPPAVVITNPDMLHLSLLAYHDRWSRFFSHLSHVIIDEVHTYRGVFGSHMAWVIARLQRVCRLYGSSPRFILSSATIGNPGELGQALLNRPVRVVTASGAPRPPRHTLLLNPLDSLTYTTVRLLESALLRGLRTIVYTGSRKMTELITIQARRRLGRQAEKISSYRAGFLPEDRRAIESSLADGELLGVISTSALELGIDIGNLDICILAGYPGSIMASRQRAGRVGRAGNESLVVMIGGEDALDQHFMRNPDDFFNRKVEPVALNPANHTIAGQHLVCAAAEAPLDQEAIIPPQTSYRLLLRKLVREGALMEAADGNAWFAARTIPQRHVDMRGSGSRYHIRRLKSRGEYEEKSMGEIDGLRALKECHPGAVYLHMAVALHVDHLDLEGHEVLVSPARPGYYTRPVVTKTTEILQTELRLDLNGCRVFYGQLRVTETVTGYIKKQVGSNRIIGRLPLDLPPQTFETQGFWLEIPEVLKIRLQERRLHFMGGIHALEHALIAMLPLLVLCDRNDIGGISFPAYPQSGRPTVFVYDGYSGGIGLSRAAFDRMALLLEKTRQAVESCPCELGCPSCVHSPKCGSGNRPIDKAACSQLLAEIVEKSRAAEADSNQKRTSTVSPQTLRHKGAKSPTDNRQSRQKQRDNGPPLYGVFDLETKRSAADVGGWHRAHRMGISVGVVYDSGEDRYLTYGEDEVERLIDHLHRFELVVGFNNRRFDNRVLSGYTSADLDLLPNLDILREIKGRLGYRLSLNRLAFHTLGVEKSGDGLQALRWYRQGRFDLLADYCRRDVEITRNLFLHGFSKGYLLFENKAGQVVRLPVDFRESIARITATPVSGESSRSTADDSP